MKKNKLLKEFSTLKIDNMRNVAGGQQSGGLTACERWEKTNGNSGLSGDWHMDKHIISVPDPELSTTDTSTISIIPIDSTITH